MESHAKVRDFEEFQLKLIPHNNKLYVILLAFVEIKKHKNKTCYPPNIFSIDFIRLSLVRAVCVYS